ncbi:hypothetical protein AM10699_36040 [Acaryochloris marina MBIC10699]|nr:hypothetical protein AM10699_36040 [Acaryochloris marina MBIC10699]
MDWGEVNDDGESLMINEDENCCVLPTFGTCRPAQDRVTKYSTFWGSNKDGK